MTEAHHQGSHRVNRLLDAVELVKQERREEARALLRELIHEDSNFEDAWLWMSVAVDSLDQSSVCLDNVLRVNPSNQYAAFALHRIREPEMQMLKRRGRYKMIRNAAFMLMWAIAFTPVAIVVILMFRLTMMLAV